MMRTRRPRGHRDGTHGADAHGAGARDAGGPVLEVVPLARRHLREVLEIERGAYPSPWTERIFHDELAQARAGARNYIAGLVGDEVVGYAGVLYAGDDAHVTNVAVREDWRSRGVATELLLELAWAARERGCAAMSLEVRHTNVGAQALYRRFGFVPAGTRARYYENRDDAIVMWLGDLQGDEAAGRLRAIEEARP